MRRPWIAAISLLIVAAAPACKKNKKQDPGPDTPPANGSRIQLSLDSLFLYAKETYLWYDALPSYSSFNPRAYDNGDDFTSLQQEMFKLSQYKINDATGKPFEFNGGNSAKYSFVEKGNAAQGIQGAVDLEGKGNDLGFNVFLVDNSRVFVRVVEKGSPAYLKGLTRGCEITRFNGVAVTPAAINPAINSSSLSVTFRKNGGAEQTIQLTKAAYTNDPVYAWKTFTNGSNITGYINLARFSRKEVAQTSLQQAFSDFAGAGVNNLVIDLRYNGGGYVETFQYVANLIAPASINGQVMFKETFNNLLQEGKAPILKTIPLMGSDGKQRKDSRGNLLTYANVDFTVAGNTKTFQKEGSLGAIKNVVFIVTGGTASASELLINSLKPYMTVKLVGDTTYGKPVGFFGIGIDKYTVYMSQFTSVNKDGEGFYYAGMAPHYLGSDDYRYDFGDSREICLAKALAYINTGIVSPLPLVAGRAGEEMTLPAGISIGAQEFNGMIEDRRVLK